MDDTLKSKILELLDQHRLMTIATNRPDGWPQATTVGYVNDGLTIYFLCSPQSQKAANLARDSRVSLTNRPRCLGPDGDHGPFDGSAGTAGHRPDRSSESHEFAGDKVPGIHVASDAETRGHRCL